MASPLPRLFIGSSSESLAVVQLLAQQLAAVAEVKPWSDRGFFRPGLYYLDNLIHELPEFDFALFVFGPDDAVESRGVTQSMPRDNVIFEFGYALAKLGRERVFHLVPKGPNLNVKVMSDLAGMKPWEYQMPEDFRGSLADLSPKATTLPPADKARVLAAMATALEDPCKFIGEAIRHLGARRRFDRSVAEGPRYVSDVYDDLLQALDRPDGNEVKNIALDMEQTWPSIRDRFMLSEGCPPTQWRSLIIDPTSKELATLQGPSFSTGVADAMIGNMTEVLTNERTRRPPGSVRYECRAYSTVPGIHGFLVNDRLALISLCGLSRKWVGGTASPYLRFEKGSHIEAADHMVESFNTLFEFQWERARRLWPTAKRPRR